jgi:spermidine/putrescine transport system ATP-binding protein
LSRSTAKPTLKGGSSSSLHPVAIDVRHVSKIFGSGGDIVRALDDVSLTIEENEFFTLLGPSGCGKTTLLRLIAGFEHPSGGHILLHGEDISPLPPTGAPSIPCFRTMHSFHT